MLRLPLDTSIRAELEALFAAAFSRIARRAGAQPESFGDLLQSGRRALSGGKRFRPAVVVAMFDAFGGDRSAVAALVPVAASFELLHTAFVIHDDVIDDDTHRRGAPNVTGEFRSRAAADGVDPARSVRGGDAAAILAGDLLLYEAGRILLLADVPADVRGRLTGILDDAVAVTIAGEFADVQNSLASGDVDAARLVAAARDKTAMYSFVSPMRAGAVLAGAGDQALVHLGAIGSELGLAFQLVDDLLGAFGSEGAAGRPVGTDLRTRKATPLVALAREGANWDAVTDALDRAHTGPVAVRTAQRELAASGAPARLRALIDAALDDAGAHASNLPPAAQDVVGELVEGVRSRIP